jgi:MFS family permease
VLTAPLVFGRLSDHIGRRMVTRSALLVHVAAVVVFLTADGVAAC